MFIVIVVITRYCISTTAIGNVCILGGLNNLIMIVFNNIIVSFGW